MALHQAQIVPALVRAVPEVDERPSSLRIGSIVLRKKDKMILPESAFEHLLLLPCTSLPLAVCTTSQNPMVSEHSSEAVGVSQSAPCSALADVTAAGCSPGPNWRLRVGRECKLDPAWAYEASSLRTE